MGLFSHALKSLSTGLDTKNIISDMGWIWVGRPTYAYSPEARKYWVGIQKGNDQHIIEYDEDLDAYQAYPVDSGNKEKDDHNMPTILIRTSDKRLLISYNTHVDTVVRRRLSTNPLDASSWGAEMTYNDEGGEFSYSSLYQSSQGVIFSVYRNRIGVVGQNSVEVWKYAKSFDGGLTFEAPIKIVDNGDNRPYIITSQDGDNIHFVMSSGHPQWNAIPMKIMHFTLDMVSGELKSTNGNVLTAPISDSNGSVIYSTELPDKCWVVDVATKEGVPRVLFTVYPNGDNINFINKDLYLGEFKNGVWITSKLGDVMDKQIENDEVYESPSYMPGARFDTSNSDIIWMPIQVNGILEIHKADVSQNPFFIEQITFNSEVDQWRPISIPNKQNNVLWLNKTHYDHWLDDYDNTLISKTINI